MRYKTYLMSVVCSRDGFQRRSARGPFSSQTSGVQPREIARPATRPRCSRWEVGLALALVLLAACAPVPISPEAARRTAGSGRAPVSIEFYLVHEAPGENVVERRMERTGEIVFLGPSPDLTERDIAWVEMQSERISGRPSLLVHFTPVGADKFAVLTRQNVGRRLAIVVNGTIISTPLIRAEIRDGRATIQGFRSATEAQALAAALGRR